LFKFQNRQLYCLLAWAVCFSEKVNKKHKIKEKNVKLFTLNIKSFIALLLILSVMVMQESAWGGTTYWQAGTGNWSTAGNWNNGEPGSNDTAYISNGGTAVITGAEACVQLVLADQPGSSGSVEMNPGVLFSDITELVGLAGTGAFVQTGGMNATYELICGFYANSSGSYDLSGAGSFLSVDYETIGLMGTGVVTQTSGTHTVSESLELGTETGAHGTYNVSGGTLAIADTLRVGNDGKGIFAVTGNGAAITSGQYSQNNQSTLNSVFDSGGISLIDVSGSALFDGTWNITDPSGNAPVGLFNVLIAAGGITGAFGNVVLPNTTDWTWGIDGGTTLWVQHVPEPTTLLLFGLGGLMLRKQK
jgi:fibronectin-binding autotransporter adhesin